MRPSVLYGPGDTLSEKDLILLEKFISKTSVFNKFLCLFKIFILQLSNLFGLEQWSVVKNSVPEMPQMLNFLVKIAL